MVRGNDKAITGAPAGALLCVAQGSTQPTTSSTAMIAKRPRMSRMVVRVIRRPAPRHTSPAPLRESRPRYGARPYQPLLVRIRGVILALPLL